MNAFVQSSRSHAWYVWTTQRFWQGQVGPELEFVEKRDFLATIAALLVSPLQSSSGSDLVDHSGFNDAIISTDRTFQYLLPQCLGGSMGSLPAESADMTGSTGAWGKGRGGPAGLPLVAGRCGLVLVVGNLWEGEKATARGAAGGLINLTKWFIVARFLKFSHTVKFRIFLFLEKDDGGSTLKTRQSGLRNVGHYLHVYGAVGWAALDGPVSPNQTGLMVLSLNWYICLKRISNLWYFHWLLWASWDFFHFVRFFFLLGQLFSLSRIKEKNPLVQGLFQPTVIFLRHIC